MRILLALSLLMLSACNSDPAAATSKSLFSSWGFQGSAGGILDLTGMKFGSQSYRLYKSGGACDCILALSGTEASGNIDIQGCSYNASASGGGADPGCAGLGDSGTFTKTDDTLTICDPTCGTYK